MTGHIKATDREVTTFLLSKAAPRRKTAHDNVPRRSPIRSCESGKQKKGREGTAAPSRGPRSPYPHEVMRRHGVRYPADFVVGFEDVIVDLELLSAVIPGGEDRTGQVSSSGWQSIQLSASI